MSFLLGSCDNRQAKALLLDVESYIQERPDSALRVLISVDSLMLNTKSLHARYSLLFAMALDKNYIDTTDVSVVMPAVNYYKRHGNPDERLKAYFYLGRIYLNNKRYDKAAVAYSLVQYYGSQESLIREVLSTMNGSLPISPGPFSVQLNMHGYQLMVRAYLSDSGVPSISTMFIP